MRKICEVPSLPVNYEDAGKVTCNYDIKVITPIYGGGAVAGVNDWRFPIRSASVRGQLRFWWRATRGVRFETAQKLFEEESKIWGNTEKASETKVVVISPPWNQPIDSKFNKNEAYALFSAIQNGHSLQKEGLDFKLKLTFEEKIKDDVLCALWAWVNFGGIGGRTRRGCGALYCEALAPKGSLGEWLKRCKAEYGILGENNSERTWPVWNFSIFSKPCDSARNAWRNAIKPMKDFRQGDENKEGVPARDGQLGFSNWPEADTLRRLHGTSSRGHEPEKREMKDWFPRAVFGLPIIFQFINSEESQRKKLKKNFKYNPPYDPEKSTLSFYKPQSIEKKQPISRMASPVLLRPLKTQDNMCYSIFIRLIVPSIAVTQALSGKTIQIEYGKKKKVLCEEDIINPQFAVYPKSPMGDSVNTGNALDAFFEYLKLEENGFREVGR